MRADPQIFRKRGQHARLTFHQNDPRLRRIDMAKILRQRIARDLGDRARHFHASRSAADDDKCHRGFARRFVGDFFRVLKCQQNTSPNLNRVFQTFQSGREFFPFRMAKVGMPRAGGENQEIVSRSRHPPS